MTPLDEARALLARQQERERECAERAEERDELPCRPVLDMPPALLAALCDELAALRAERDARALADQQRARQRQRIQAEERRDWETIERMDREDEEAALAKGEG